jgi:hypothetical protein
LEYLPEDPGTEVERSGFVYLLGHAKALKIGWSERHPLEGRLQQLQTGSSERLELLGLILARPSEERTIQGLFVKYRLHGEWFSRNDDILAHFAKHGEEA